MSRMLEKLSDYARMGVPAIRGVEPKAKQIYAFESGALEPVVHAAEALPGGRCSIDWAAVQALLD